MMNLLPWLSLFLILVLEGCGSTSSTIQPTQGIPLRPSSVHPTTATTFPSLASTSELIVTKITVPTAILPTATHSLTFTPVSVHTLEPVQAMATIEPLLREPMNCAVPCFWGIVPGKTRFDEARNFFSQLGYIPFDGKEPNSGRYFYTIEYEPNSDDSSSVTLYSLNDLVGNIVLTPHIIKQEEGSPRQWIAYSPETLIKIYGKPSRVEFGLDWGPNFVIVMIMYFDDSDLIALYSGYNMISDRPHSPQLCPLTAPFDHIRLWMGHTPPNPPQMPSIPLEKVTSLTIDQFAQLMLGDPQAACFTINGDAFQ